MAGRRDRFGSFPTRVALLLCGAVLASGALATQVVRLTVFEHEEHAERTARAMRRSGWLPFVRGSLLDRRGEPLAEDRASWEVRVEYAAITGRWVDDRAAELARREVGAGGWARLGPDGRAAAAARHRAGFAAELAEIRAALAAAGGLAPEELARRFASIERTVSARAERIRERRRQLEVERAAGTGRAPVDAADGGPIREEAEAHAVLAEVDDATALRLASLAARRPGLIEVVPATRRTQPWSRIELDLDRSALPSPIRSDRPLPLVLSGVADHLVGSVRTTVHREDLERRPFRDPDTGEVIDPGGYAPDRDGVGSSGLERALEDRLRGKRGRLERDLERGTAERFESERGEDIRLTLDIRLQARAEAAFRPELGLATVQPWQWGSDRPPLPFGYPLAGAAAVIEIDTGDILALVSAPSLAADAGGGLNRATEGAYPPGSIVKPLVLAAAIGERVAGPESVIECRGHYFEGVTTNTRCWIWRPERDRDLTHGPLAGDEAIARSCNIYFYALAQRLGPERLVAWFRRFGLGAPPAVGLPPEREAAGGVPDPSTLGRGNLTGLVALGIGQGTLLWSPVQAAQAYATLARGGEVVPASLLLDRPERGRVTERLGLDPRGVDVALSGLRQAVERSYGTAHHLTLPDGTREPILEVPGVRIWGKTGTAQAPPLRLDRDGDGTPETSISADHAWFVGLVGRDRPEYAIAVLLEHAGSGGKAAGPIAAEIVRALRAEGYLDPVPARGRR